MKIYGEEIHTSEALGLLGFVGACFSGIYYVLKRFFTFVILVEKLEDMDRRLTKQDEMILKIFDIVNSRKSHR